MVYPFVHAFIYHLSSSPYHFSSPQITSHHTVIFHSLFTYLRSCLLYFYHQRVLSSGSLRHDRGGYQQWSPCLATVISPSQDRYPWLRSQVRTWYMRMTMIDSDNYSDSDNHNDNNNDNDDTLTLSWVIGSVSFFLSFFFPNRAPYIYHPSPST